MKIAGDNTIPFPVDQVWDALLDPAVLVRTIPGCERMETTGDNAYDMTVTAGVAAIRGTYSGTCALSDLEPHSSLVMRLQGAGAPGTVDATVNVRFAGGRRRHRGRLGRRRGRRRHGRWRRPADAVVGVEADGGGALRRRGERELRRRPGG